MSTELRAFVVLLAALLGLEVAARLFETRLSKDVAHLRSLPVEAARLRVAPAGHLKVLILGNSLAREGLDREVLQRGLEVQTGRPVVLAAMHPDGSRVEEWLYGYRRYFDQAGARPDLVLLCSGRAHLLDGLRDLDAVAAFHVSWRDLPGFIRDQKLGVDAICQVVAARSSALFAHRRRVQPLLFYHWMPRYESTVNLIQASRQGEARQSAAAEETVHAFAALLETCRAAKVRVALLPVPLPEAYELPAAVVEAAKAGGAVTLGPPPHLPVARFPDGYHLDAEGAALWTSALQKHPDWATLGQKLQVPETR
jgi:hypothetical protein